MPLETTIDPVCGMKVDPVTARARTRHEDKEFFFCCDACATKFRTNPKAYLDGKPKSQGMVMLGSIASAPAPAAAAAAAYTCPMHPDVRQPKPGTCPKCGMALEPDLQA